LKKIQVIKINCVGLQNSKGFYQSLLSEFQIKSTKSKNIEDTIRTTIINSGKIILLLDEIDQLTRNVIYNVYSWTTLKKASLILIGIANDIDLIQSLALSSRTGANPLLINFDAYTKSQMGDIIQSRINDYPDLFDPKAIEFIASKCATSGDIRKALQLCIKVLETKIPDPAGNITKVSVKDVVLIINATMAPKIISGIQSLPLTQQLILCCIVKLTEGKEISLQSVYDNYRQATKQSDIGYLNFQEFVEIIDILSTTELISVTQKKEKSGKTPNKNVVNESKVTTPITQAQILFSVASDMTLTNILTNFLNLIIVPSIPSDM